MASVFTRKGRAHYYAKIRDPRTLEWQSIVTPFRTTDPAGKRRALLWAAERDKIGAENKRLANHEAWANWVPTWLQQTYAYNANTLTRYQNAWAPLHEFLIEQHVVVPRQIAYAHAGIYLTWRTRQSRRCGKPINHNTAVTEIKVLSRVVREAHRRGYCDSNPLYQLGLKRVNVAEKPELSDDEIARIRAALATYPEWMRVSFEIALHQGCRLSETALPLDHVDESAGTITFTAKGRNGVKKVFTTALHPGINPLIRELRAAGRTTTCDLPKMAAKEWWKFRRDHDLAHTKFHSTRVTVITRLARAGVTQQKAMRFVGHASTTVHRIYQRLQAQDVADVTRSLSFGIPDKPGSPGAGQPSPQTAP